jgi:hypothetical protein
MPGFQSWRDRGYRYRLKPTLTGDVPNVTTGRTVPEGLGRSRGRHSVSVIGMGPSLGADEVDG